MTSKEQRIRDILNELCDKCDLLGSEKGQGQFIDQAEAQIKAEMRLCVPEKKDLYDNVQDHYHSSLNWERDGFNQCRTETLKRMDCL